MNKKDIEKCRNLIDEISDYPKLHERYEHFIHADKDRAWKEFCKKEHIRFYQRFDIDWKKVSRYAAILAIPVILTIGMWTGWNAWKPDAQTSLSVVKETLLKGATLTLADGTVITLDSTASHQLAQHTVDATGGKNILMYDNVLKTEVSNQETQRMNTLVTNENNYFELTLEDGTHVYLNTSSKLVYPEHFASDCREVKLEGEGYFQISKDQSRPFIIEMGGIRVRQLGTEFNAYSRPGKLNEVVLINGRVEMEAESGLTVTLEPGQMGVADETNSSFSVCKVNTDLYTAWYKGYLSFNDLPLRDLVLVLSRWYGVDMEFADTSLAELKLSGRLKRYDDLSVILERLEYTRELRFVYRQGKIIIESGY